jgi:sec-independent protein translocase protein TatA
MGLPELLSIFIMVLIIFGAEKLPAIGAGLGKGIRNFRRRISDDKNPLETKEHRPIT